MAHGTKFMEVSVSSSAMPLLAKLQPTSNNFADTSASDARNTSGINQPKILYAENVLPTAKGLASTSPLVFANSLLDGNTATSFNYSDIVLAEATTLVDSERYKAVAIFMVRDSGSVYTVDALVYNTNGTGFSYQTSLFTNSLSTTDRNAEFTIAFNEVLGVSVVSISMLYDDASTSKRVTKVYRVVSNTPTTTLEDITITELSELTLNNVSSGAVSDVVKGFIYSSGYFIGYTDNKLVWSNPQAPYEFTPSEITGAGSATPDGLIGTIITCRTTDVGFNVYTTNGIISARLGNNITTPFIYRPINFNAGINNIWEVTESYPQFAITSAGLLAVTNAQTENLKPEMGDFITAGVYEYYSDVVHQVVEEQVPDPLETKVTYISDRYLCISYRKKGMSYYEYFLVFDTVLNSYGKIRVAHMEIFPLELNVLGDFIKYSELEISSESYEQLQQISYSMVRKSGGVSAPTIGYTIGVVQYNGSLSVVDPSITNSAPDSAVVVGNFSIKTGMVTALDHVMVEESPATDYLQCWLNTSYDGNDVGATTEMYLSVNAGGYKKFDTLMSGLRHSVSLEGAFNLTKLTVAMRGQGYR